VCFKPDKIRAVLGDGSALGMKIIYVCEESPLGTGGAVRNAEGELDDTTIVFNGDVLTDIDLGPVVSAHRVAGAAATIVLAPVPDPSAYGLVEVDAGGRVQRFIEKPQPGQITTNMINAGIYILQTPTLELVPRGQSHSIERGFFPNLLARGDRVQAYIHRGYWLDIGTPEKYLQAQHDILSGSFKTTLDGQRLAGGVIDPTASVSPDCRLTGPFYIGPGCQVASGCLIGPDTVLVGDVRLAAGARVAGSVIWTGCRLGEEAVVEGAILSRDVSIGARATISAGAILGEATHISDFSRY
jgi:mannose-1-phosphate guanylyltransferase